MATFKVYTPPNFQKTAAPLFKKFLKTLELFLIPGIKECVYYCAHSDIENSCVTFGSKLGQEYASIYTAAIFFILFMLFGPKFAKLCSQKPCNILPLIKYNTIDY